MRITAFILLAIGFFLLFSNLFLAILLLFFGLVLFLISIPQTKPEPGIKVEMSIIGAPAPRTESEKELMRQQKPVGNIDAVCPYCDKTLDKKPGRKKKCPHCGKFIFVRTRPCDEQQVLVTEEQIEEITEQWSIVNGTHDDFLATKKRFADEKEKLSKQFGTKASDNDVRWSLLNKNAMSHARKKEWGLYRCDRFDMGEHLKKEGKPKDALRYYLEVCYLDLNGPNNTGGIDDPELLKEFPEWDPQGSESFLAPGVVNRAARIIRDLELDLAGTEEIYLKHTSRIHTSMRLPLSPHDTWPKIRNELFPN